MTELLSTENMRSIIDGQTSLPEIKDESKVVMKSSKPEDSFRTPALNKGDFKQNSFHYIIDLPGNIRDLVRDGVLVISVQTKGNWSAKLQEQKLQLFEKELNMSEAEKVCVSLGGHLPSVLSKEEQEEITKLANGNEVWLGGKKNEDDGYEWLDQRVKLSIEFFRVIR